MRVEPILGGAGQIRHIEVIGPDHDPYRGFAVQVPATGPGRWVREYVNSGRGRFSPLEGEVADGSDGYVSTWRGVSPTRTRESRLVSERHAEGKWRRTMSISEDDRTTWRVLWTDELSRVDLR